MVSTPTPKFRPAPSVMLVSVADDVAAVVAEAVKPLTVLRAAHASAAAERMLVTTPLVVVLGDHIAAVDEERLCERADAIGAEVLRAASYGNADELATAAAMAVITADRRRH